MNKRIVRKINEKSKTLFTIKMLPKIDKITKIIHTHTHTHTHTQKNQGIVYYE